MIKLMRSSVLSMPDQRFGLRIRVAREINYPFENERKQLTADMKVWRRKHREDYWQMQTQIENKFLEDHRATTKQWNRQKMDRWRTAICGISLRTKEKIAFLENKERKMLEAMRMQDIKNIRKDIKNKFMLDGLEMEAKKHWPNRQNLAERIDTDLIIPQTILNYQEYTNKLQRLAFFAEMGHLDAVQQVLDNQLVLEKKN